MSRRGLAIKSSQWGTVADLFLDVVERIGRIDGKANQDDVRVGI